MHTDVTEKHNFEKLVNMEHAINYSRNVNLQAKMFG